MHDEQLIPVQELCSHHNIEIGFIRSLYEHGLIDIITVKEHIFVSSSQLCDLEKMIRLHYELDVNVEGIDVIRHLLKKLEEAQEEIARLKGQLKFYEATEQLPAS